MTDAFPPAPPNEILDATILNIQSTTADLSLVSGGGGTTGFQVAISPGGVPPADCNSNTVFNLFNNTLYTFNGLTPDTLYSYRACAYNGTPEYTTGFIGAFNTAVINSDSNIVNPIVGWAGVAQLPNLGVGQNRALIITVGRENGSDITGVNFGGQAMTLVSERTQGNLSVEIYILDEAGIQAANGDTATASFAGNIPFRVSYGSIVFENVDQTLLAASTDTAASGNGNTLSGLLNVDNGGYSILASSNSNRNRIGSMGTPGWNLGFSRSTGAFVHVAGSHENTAAGTDIARVNYNANAAITLTSAYLELAPPTDPSHLNIASLSDTLANLTWDSGFGTTNSYVLAYQAGTPPADCSSGTLENISNLEAFTLTGLNSDTLYGARLCSENVQGVLSPGITLTFQTNDIPAPAPNEILSLNSSSVSDSEISLNWQNGGGSTEIFTISYQSGPTAPADCNSGTIIDAGDSTARAITGLTENTLYSFRVCATNAEGIHSPGLTIQENTQASSSTEVTLSGNWQSGLTHSASPGTNRGLIFIVSSDDSVNANVINVTYGTQPLSFAQEALSIQGNTFGRVEIWYLLESDLAAATSTNFNVTWSDGNLENRLYAHAVYENIDQTNPVFSTGQNGSATGLNPINLPLSTISGGLSIVGSMDTLDGVYSFGNGWTFGTNQTGTGTSLGTAHLASSTSGTETALASHTNTGQSAIAGVHFRSAEAEPVEITNLNVNSTSNNSIGLDWISGNGSTTGFFVAYQIGLTAPADCDSGIIINAGVNNQRTVSGLSQNTSYSFRVCSYNATGENSPGLTITATTDPAPTVWTGGVNTDWFNPGNWSAGLPNPNTDCIVPNLANDPTIDGSIQSLAQCKNLTLEAPLTIDGSGTATELEIFGNIKVTGAGVVSENNGTLSLSENSAITQNVSSVSNLPNLNFKKNFGGTVEFNGDLTVGTLMTFGSNQILNLGSTTLNIENSSTINGGTELNLLQGSQLNIGNNQTLTLNGGSIIANGAIDTTLLENPGYGSAQANLGVIGGSGQWNFNATSGSINLQGVRIDRIDPSGFQITGSTAVTSYSGVHFTNLPVGPGNIAMFVDTTGTFPSSGAFNAFDYVGTPVPGQYTIQAPGQCGNTNHTYTFLEWFGNFDSSIGNDSVLDNAPVCTIIMETSASPVTMAKVYIEADHQSALLQWETSAEFFHKGFQVYRQYDESSELIKVNDSLITNSGLGVLIRGEYEFTDTGLEKDHHYRYFLEDVPVVGFGKTYGPYVITTASSPNHSKNGITYLSPTYGVESSPNGGNQNTNESGNQTSVDSIQSPESSAGVRWIPKPDGSYRLIVQPPSLQTALSKELPETHRTFLQDYHSMTEAGKPALPQLVLYLPVHSYFSGVTTSVLREENNSFAMIPEPAAEWIPVTDENRLQAHFSKDSSIYNGTTVFPNEGHFAVQETSVKKSETHHLKVKLFPTLFLAKEGKINHLEDLVLDIQLNSTNEPELQKASPGEKSLGSQPGVRLKTTRNGYHSVSYEELFEKALETEFQGAFANELEFSYRGTPIPFQFQDNNEEGFGPGDLLTFKVNVNSTSYSNTAHILLNRTTNSFHFFRGQQWLSSAPLDTSLTFETHRHYEVDEPSQFINDRSLGDLRDHYYWQRIFLDSANSSQPVTSQFCHPVNIEGLSGSRVDLEVQAAMRSTFSLAQETMASVYWDGFSNSGLNLTFSDRQHKNHMVSLDVPSGVSDNPNLCIGVSSFSGATGEFRILDLDSFTLKYTTILSSNTSTFSNLQPQHTYEINIDNNRGPASIFESSSFEKNSQFLLNPTGSNTYQFTTGPMTTPQNVVDIVYHNEVLKSESLEYYTVPQDLVLTHKNSDMVILTSENFLPLLDSFISHKTSMGIQTTAIDVQTVYDQFSYGETSPYALKEFIAALSTAPKSKVKYLMIAADGTMDSKNITGFGNENTTPIYLKSSTYADYASDLWLVTDPDDNLLDISIGRIPARNATDLEAYLNKVTSYEQGQSQPKGLSISSILAEDPFIDFREISAQLKRSSQGIDYQERLFAINTPGAEVKDHMFETLNNNLFVNYLGHGSEFILGDDHLNGLDVANLNNGNSLPIFIGVNCLTGYFEGEDTSFKSLGESLTLQPSGGSIATLAANTILSPREQEMFTQSFYRELNEARLNKPQLEGRLGDIIQNAHQYLKAQNLSSPQTESFLLLGDPSLSLPDSFYQFESSSAPKNPASPEEDNNFQGNYNSAGGSCGSIGPSGSSSPMNAATLLLLLLFAIVQSLRPKYAFRK